MDELDGQEPVKLFHLRPEMLPQPIGLPSLNAVVGLNALEPAGVALESGDPDRVLVGHEVGGVAGINLGEATASVDGLLLNPGGQDPV